MKQLPQLQYCNCRQGDLARCAQIAKYRVVLVRRTEKIPDKPEKFESFRCEKHRLAGTTGKKVYVVTEIDQSAKITEILNFLRPLLGTEIRSTVHTAKGLLVKYVKEETCGVMCFQPVTKKWEFVYYNQIVQ